jgi:Mg2+/Co2+ transporter CorB
MVIAAEANKWMLIWGDWGIAIQNVTVFLLLIVIALLVRKACTLPDWVSAARQLRVKRLPMIASWPMH